MLYQIKVSLIGLKHWNIVTALQCKWTKQSNKIQDAFFVQSKLSLWHSLITSCLDNWNILYLKHSWLLINIMPTHPVVHFVCQGYTLSEKVASSTALGETEKTARKIFVRLVVRANAPLHDTIRGASLYQEVPCWVKGDAICVQSCRRVRWSSNTAIVLHHSD